MLVTSQGRKHMPGFHVETVDSTGAGDAFSAALIYGALCGVGLEARALLANTLGALATTVWGGGASMPPLQVAVDLLSQQKTGGQPWDGWLDEAIASLEKCIHLPSVEVE